MQAELQGPPTPPFGWARDYADKMLHVIDEIWKHKWDMPAVILAYTTIDAFASLDRGPFCFESSGQDFKCWANRYLLLPNNGLGEISAEELWASRCGLLHAYSPEATAVRTSGVRRVCFVTGSGVEWPLRGTQPDLFLAPHLLFDALRSGVASFFANAAADPGWRALVETRQEDLFIPWTS
jgi:hypothetical protein